MRDRTALGTVAGLVGAIPGIILNYISVQVGFSEFYDFQLSAGVYLHPGLTNGSEFKVCRPCPLLSGTRKAAIRVSPVQSRAVSIAACRFGGRREGR